MLLIVSDAGRMIRGNADTVAGGRITTQQLTGTCNTITDGAGVYLRCCELVIQDDLTTPHRHRKKRSYREGRPIGKDATRTRLSGRREGAYREGRQRLSEGKPGRTRKLIYRKGEPR